jgi:hypothetical protein
LNDNKKKSKENLINASTDDQKSKTLDNDENSRNGKIDEDSKVEDVNNGNIEKSDSDMSSNKGDDDEDKTILSDDDMEEKKIHLKKLFLICNLEN